MASSTNDGEPQSDDDPFEGVEDLLDDLTGAASSSATAIENDGSGGGGEGATSSAVQNDDDVVFLGTRRQPQVGEGWRRKSDQQYFIIVRVSKPLVLISANETGNLFSTLQNLSRDFEYVDEGVQIGQRWQATRDVVGVINTGEIITITDLPIYFTLDQSTNQYDWYVGGYANEGDENDEIKLSVTKLLQSMTHLPSVTDLTNEGTSSNVNSQRKRKRQKKEENDKEDRNNRIKDDQVCPICQESLNNNLDNPEEKIVIDGGKVLIGNQRVKILKCCGNAIHYTCFLRYVEANKNKSKVKCPFNDELGKVPKNGVQNFVDKWLRDPNSIVRKEIPKHSKIVYRLSCQLKF